VPDEISVGEGFSLLNFQNQDERPDEPSVGVALTTVGPTALGSFFRGAAWPNAQILSGSIKNMVVLPWQ
jgi:hypothetical protein